MIETHGIKIGGSININSSIPKVAYIICICLIKVVKELTQILLTHPPFASADITVPVLPVNNADSTAKFLSALETEKNGVHINLLTLHSCLLSHGSRKLY